MLETTIHHLFFFITTDPDHLKLYQKYFHTRGTKEINFDLAIIINRALLPLFTFTITTNIHHVKINISNTPTLVNQYINPNSTNTTTIRVKINYLFPPNHRTPSYPHHINLFFENENSIRSNTNLSIDPVIISNITINYKGTQGTTLSAGTTIITTPHNNFIGPMLETSLHHLFFFIATDPDHIKLCQKYFYTRGTKEINFDLAIITNRALLPSFTFTITTNIHLIKININNTPTLVNQYINPNSTNTTTIRVKINYLFPPNHRTPSYPHHINLFFENENSIRSNTNLSIDPVIISNITINYKGTQGTTLSAGTTIITTPHNNFIGPMLETSLHHLFFFIATDPDHIKLCQKYFYTRGTKEINFDLAIITNRALLQFQLIIHSIQPTTLTTSVTPPTIKLIPSHTHFSNHQRIVHLLVQQTASPFFIVIISSFGDIWYTQSQMRNARSLNIQTMDTPYIHIRKAARLEIRNGLHMASKWQLLHLLSSGLHIVLDNKHGLGGQKLQGKHVYGGNYLGGLRVDISHHTTSLSFQVCHPISSFFFHLPYNSNNFLLQRT